MKDCINTELIRLLDNAITESLAGIQVKAETGEIRAKLRSEIISTREAIARHPAFKQMIDIAFEWLVARVQPERERLQIAEQRNKDNIAHALKQLDEFKADYELKKPSLLRLTQQQDGCKFGRMRLTACFRCQRDTRTATPSTKQFDLVD